MNCPNCGTVLSDGAVFCHNCGSPVSIDQQAVPAIPLNQDPYQQQPYQQPDYQQSEYPQQSYQQPDYQQPDYSQPNQGPYQQPSQDAYQPTYRSQPQPTYSQQPMYPQPTAMTPGQKSKIAAGILGILLGALGIHKFYLGYTKAGVIMLLVTLLTFGIGGVVMEIIGLIEGIIYLTKSDQEFYQTYELGEKQWF